MTLDPRRRLLAEALGRLAAEIVWRELAEDPQTVAGGDREQGTVADQQVGGDDKELDNVPRAG